MSIKIDNKQQFKQSKKQTIFTMQERINALLEVKQNNPHLSFGIDCRILEIQNEYENKIAKKD